MATLREMRINEQVARDTFTYFMDPGHGWLRVYDHNLEDVGLTAADFSRYSYVATGPYKGLRYYLEEDCDAPKFLQAWEAKYPGRKPIIVESHDNGNSFIRRLEPNMEGWTS